MLFQPTNITPDEINGTGCVDATEDLDVSWQVNGTSAMVAYAIYIYQNDAASTQLYTTGKQTLTSPFWGKNALGKVQYYEATIASSTLATAGITNGNEYKLVIHMWYGSGGDDKITQTTASVFKTRATPTVSISNYASIITTKSFTFTGAYTQSQGDSLRWIHWQIAIQDHKDEPVLDTGKITGTGLLSCVYDGFVPNGNYSVKLTIETENGIEVTTGWKDFSATYTVPEPTGSVTAEWKCNLGCVVVSWSQMTATSGYTVFRRVVGTEIMYKVADLSNTASAIKDYAVSCGNSYIYYVFPSGQYAFLSSAATSSEVYVSAWKWAIIEASKNDSGTYSAQNIYMFQYGISCGSMSNNNAPSVQQNFTRYPTRQISSLNYLSGSLGGYIGSITIVDGSYQYSDSVDDATALFNLSTTENDLFLRDPKGRFLKIGTSSATKLDVTTKSTAMQQSVTISWVETGNAENVMLTSSDGDPFWVEDQIIFTEVSVLTDTGTLIWTRDSEYDNGSMLTVDSNGNLVQESDGSFRTATMSIDATTGQLTATV